MHRSSCTLIIITTGFVIGFMPRAHFARWNITSTTDTIHCRGPHLQLKSLPFSSLLSFRTLLALKFLIIEINIFHFLNPFTNLTFGNGTKNMILNRSLGSWIDWIADDNPNIAFYFLLSYCTGMNLLWSQSKTFMSEIFARDSHECHMAFAKCAWYCNPLDGGPLTNYISMIFRSTDIVLPRRPFATHPPPWKRRILQSTKSR